MRPILGNSNKSFIMATEPARSIPRWLYRYQAIPPAGAESRLEHLIKHDELHFSSPLRFNDPFDATCLFRLKGSTSEDWEKFFADFDPPLTQEEKSTRIAAALEHESKRGWSQSRYDRERLERVMRQGLEEVRILCLTERWNSLLMWAHYGAGHRGVCLQFDGRTLANRWWCEPVRYRTGYPSFAEFLETKGDGRLTSAFLLLNKSTQWRYEREWRAIAFTFAGKVEPAELPPGSLRGIIFGCLTPADDRARVTAWLKTRQSSVPLLLSQVRRHPDAYRLVREDEQDSG